MAENRFSQKILKKFFEGSFYFEISAGSFRVLSTEFWLLLWLFELISHSFLLWLYLRCDRVFSFWDLSPLDWCLLKLHFRSFQASYLVFHIYLSLSIGMSWLLMYPYLSLNAKKCYPHIPVCWMFAFDIWTRLWPALLEMNLSWL